MAKEKTSVQSPGFVKGKSVLFLPIHEEKKTAGGLFIPDTDNSKSRTALIVAVGANCCEEFVDETGKKRILQPGDKVLYSTYLNTNLIIGDVNYLIGTEMDAHLIFPKEDVHIIVKESTVKKYKRGFDGHDGVTMKN